MLDQIEHMGLLGHSQGMIRSSGAHTDELPAAGFDPQHPRTEDVWTSGMAQILTSVSPAMFKEFELDYAVTWFERFGLVYYGCCEALDDKMDHVRRIPMSGRSDEFVGGCGTRRRADGDFVSPESPTRHSWPGHLG
jgi:hypothetical protein